MCCFHAGYIKLTPEHSPSPHLQKIKKTVVQNSLTDVGSFTSSLVQHRAQIPNPQSVQMKYWLLIGWTNWAPLSMRQVKERRRELLLVRRARWQAVGPAPLRRAAIGPRSACAGTSLLSCSDTSVRAARGVPAKRITPFVPEAMAQQ